jgi:putative transcriptional regulator
LARNHIIQLRKKLGLTQRALADRAGTSQQQVQRIEAGVQGVRLELAARIATALGTDLAEIFPSLAPGSKRGSSARSRYAIKPKKFVEAGLDPDPKYWTARFIAADGRVFEYEVPSDEKDRLKKIFSHAGSTAAVFTTRSQCVALNPRKVAAAHFLWEGYDLTQEEDEDDSCRLKLHLIGTGEPVVFDVKPDQRLMGEDEDGSSSQLQRLFFELESGLDDVVLFDDEDGERVYIRPTEVLAIEVPLFCCEPSLWNAHMEGLTEDEEAEKLPTLSEAGK